MTLRNIGLIFRREVADQFRDRRTLFMIAVLPVLLYPALGIGMMQMTVLFSEQPRTVVILGADQLPPPELLDGNHFARRWFRNPDDADRLVVITDRPDSAPVKEGDSAEHAGRASPERMLLSAQRMAELLKEISQSPSAPAAASELDGPEPRRTQLAELLAQSGFQVLIVVPHDFRRNLEDWRTSIAERQVTSQSDFPRPIILQNSADEKSLIAHKRVMEVF